MNNETLELTLLPTAEGKESVWKYVRFAWRPFEVAVSIFNVNPSIKTNFKTRNPWIQFCNG